MLQICLYLQISIEFTEVDFYITMNHLNLLKNIFESDS